MYNITLTPLLREEIIAA
jgi:hypothetical protein